MSFFHMEKLFSSKMSLCHLFVCIFLIDLVFGGHSSPPLSDHRLGTPNRLADNDQGYNNESNLTKNVQLGPCQVCRFTVKSFISVSFSSR